MCTTTIYGANGKTVQINPGNFFHTSTKQHSNKPSIDSRPEACRPDNPHILWVNMTAKHNTSFLWESKRELGSDSRILTLSIRQLHLLIRIDLQNPWLCLHSVPKRIYKCRAVPGFLLHTFRQVSSNSKALRLRAPYPATTYYHLPLKGIRGGSPGLRLFLAHSFENDLVWMTNFIITLTFTNSAVIPTQVYKLFVLYYVSKHSWLQITLCLEFPTAG